MKKNIDKTSFYQLNFAKDVFKYAPKYVTVFDILTTHNVKTFLDVGCGDGSFAEALKRKLPGSKVFGVDISSNAIRSVKKKGIVGVCMDIDERDFPFKSHSFDGIFCGEVIEHVYSTDHLLSELYRILRPGGMLIITTPNLSSWFNRLSVLLGYQPIFSDVSLKYSIGHLIPLNTSFGHLRLFTLYGLSQLVEKHKFSVRKVLGFGINDRVGIGKRYSLITKALNTLFQKPSWSSDICLVLTK